MTILATAAITATAAAAAFLGGSISGPSSGSLVQAGGTGRAQAGQQSASRAAPTVTLNLRTSTPQLAKCFPKARSQVTVLLTTDSIGKDTFTIRAWGLRPQTDYTVFLIQKAGPNFGAAEYIGDFTTNKQGQGVNVFTLIVEEAFAFNNATHARTDLNSVGFWFADPKADDGCLGKKSPVTGFDGDGSAGVQMMNSANARLP
jgi:hypothetical protein